MEKGYAREQNEGEKGVAEKGKNRKSQGGREEVKELGASAQSEEGNGRREAANDHPSSPNLGFPYLCGALREKLGFFPTS